jgi:dTDP-4-amino-4,6-dideoxygalactose transaminase
MSPSPFLPFSRPSIDQAAIDEVVACLRSGWITTGPRVQKFEAMLREYFAAPSVHACSSATAGLLMALLSLELQPGDEVITTPLTFAGTLNPIVLAGGTPRLVDVERGTYNLDMSRLAAAVTPRTRAILPVHFAGLPVDLDAVYELAARHGLRVIEDAAHCIGGEYRGRKIGSFGDTQVFSFHPNKNITTGEGGCVVTRDAKMRRDIELLRFHGIDRDATPEFARRGLPHYDITLAGYKFNMMDLQAALGLHQLPRLDEFNDRRRRLADRYQERLAGCPGLTCHRVPSYPHKHTWHLFAPLVDSDATGASRDDLMLRLKAKGIGTGLHYQAIHLSSFYGKRYGWTRGDFPNAEYISNRIISLPLFPDMTEADQDRVVAAIADILGAART